MTLKHWRTVHTNGFDFGEDGPKRPWVVVVRRPIWKATPESFVTSTRARARNGPVPTGEVVVTRYLDGKLVERWEESGR